MTISNTLRVGVVGAGPQGEHHLRALRELTAQREPIELVAVADADRELARSAGERYATAAYGSLAEMHREAGIDGVISAVSNRFHADVAEAALGLGLHVLSEKPMAPTLADARRMLDAEAAADRFLMIGYPWPGRFAWLREQVRGGAIGAVRAADLRFLCEDGIPDRPSFWDAETGGVILDFAGHPLTALYSIVDSRPRRVRATSSGERGRARCGRDFGAEDTARAEIEHWDGLVAELNVSWATGRPPEKALGLTLVGDDGTADGPLHDEGATGAFKPVVRAGGQTLVGPAPPTYVASIREGDRNWARACLGLEPLRLPAQRAHEAERVAHAIRRAARDGGWASVEDV